MAEPQRITSKDEEYRSTRNARDRREVDRRRTYTPNTSTASPQTSRERITYRSPTAYTQNAAESDMLRETTSDTFNNEQYAGGIPTKPAGIQNVQVDYRTKRSPTSVAANTNRPPLDRNKRIRDATEIQQTTNQSTQPATETRVKKRKKRNPVKRVISVAYRTAARASLLGAYAWTGFIWLTIQIPLAIIGFLAIGVIIGIERFVGSGVTQTLFNTLINAIGVNWDFYLVAFLCYMVVVFFCYAQIFGVWFQTTFTGMKPLSGRGSGFKYATFLLALLMYWIPGVNLFPWVWLWIFAIGLNPR